MSEFGHKGVIIPGVGCLDSWGAGPFEILVSGKKYSFEDSDRFGPLILNKNGNPSERQPGERSKFWEAHHAWKRQGRKVKNGLCVWEPLKPGTFKRIGGNHAEVESHPDDGCDEWKETQ